jgi:predicted dehydrogenase
LGTSLAWGAAAALPAAAARPRDGESPQETLGVGIIGAGGRGNELARAFGKASGARVTAVADPDSARAEKLANERGARAYRDLRALLEDPAVDVVAIATCNHWHCLAALMAMDAGKDVYVEKPLSHSQWEGRQVVAAARARNRVVQLGTQQRSDPMQAELKQFLHDEGALGAIQYVQASRLGPRGPIGKRSEPLEVPDTVDYDLWLGPAQDEPLFRDRLHYDWHWDWNTGSGEMGNWGVHILDDVRNVAYRDRVALPRKVMAMGGRLVWNDAGDSPNLHYALFETETFPTLIALSNLRTTENGKKRGWRSSPAPGVSSPGTGYVVACEGGYLLGQRHRARAVDRDGKTIREFRGGDIVALHVANFLDAVRAGDATRLHAEIETGHYSTGWCNLANIGFQVADAEYGGPPSGISVPEVWDRLMGELDAQLQPLGLAKEQLLAGPVLTHDAKTERFEGAGAERANALLKREYRRGFKVTASA